MTFPKEENVFCKAKYYTLLLKNFQKIYSNNLNNLNKFQRKDCKIAYGNK